MSDILTTDLSIVGYPAQNIESITISGDSVTVAMNYPGLIVGGSPVYISWESAISEFVSRSNGLTQSSFDFFDSTTGVSYEIDAVPGSMAVGFGLVPAGNGALGDVATLTFKAILPPFQGTITGVIPCFVAGTLLDVPAGRARVEDLEPGDLVTTADGVGKVKWIGRRRLGRARVVRFSACSLGDAMPRRDLTVSRDHGMLVDGALVPAGLLVNGTTIIEECRESVVFFHIELDHHAILLAEGAHAESYLDTGNRTQFANCPLDYDPITAIGESSNEMVVAGAPLERVLQSLRSKNDAAERQPGCSPSF